MSVRVMHVWDVRMLVAQPLMAMPVCMRLAGGIVGPMRVLVVLVVHVAVRVLQWLVFMLVRVILGDMQPDAESHQEAGRNQLNRDRLPQ